MSYLGGGIIFPSIRNTGNVLVFFFNWSSSFFSLFFLYFKIGRKNCRHYDIFGAVLRQSRTYVVLLVFANSQFQNEFIIPEFGYSWKMFWRHLSLGSYMCFVLIQRACHAAIDYLAYSLSVNTSEKINLLWEFSSPYSAKRPRKVQMFPKLCWKADKESAFNRCLVPGVGVLVAVNDVKVFLCLTGFYHYTSSCGSGWHHVRGWGVGGVGGWEGILASSYFCVMRNFMYLTWVSLLWLKHDLWSWECGAEGQKRCLQLYFCQWTLIIE